MRRSPCSTDTPPGRWEAEAPFGEVPSPAALGAKLRLRLPKSRPMSLVGRENTPGMAEIAPNQSAGGGGGGSPPPAIEIFGAQIGRPSQPYM
jgi:hypothetical protein